MPLWHCNDVRHTVSIAIALLAWAFPTVLGQSQCLHEEVGVELPLSGSGQGVLSNATVLRDGQPVMHTVGLNMTRLYYYENFNVTTMSQPDRYRKLIIKLEPCEGVAYLFVRKTRRCWPNPHSCCHIPSNSFLISTGSSLTSTPPCNPVVQTTKCTWTHFNSVIDGSKDAAPTFFEVPLSSTKYYISVFAPKGPNQQYSMSVASYRLTVLADIGAYPRPGLQGRLQVKQTGDMSVELAWEEATFLPAGVSAIRRYYVYSSLLLDRDIKQNEAVFINPGKVMNSVCGLEINAVRYGSPLTASGCRQGTCKVVISGMVPRRRYMFNIVAESQRQFNASYSGIIVSTDWTQTSQLWSDKTTGLIGAICGTIFGVIVIGYLWIVKLYA